MDLKQLLASLDPELVAGEFVFCSVALAWTDSRGLQPVATFREREGLTLVLPKQEAELAGLVFDGVFRQITLRVHSNLQAVGLTASVSAQLAARGISANVIAAYYHDHIFVPAARAEEALQALRELGG
ncbi:ACT domain-containing protein [Pseudomaricurvus sp. HS19]|uniref:ACT domain-containing protein n=1 Tax=Pseudomaricurvus sp. HS19 TaxID=2692626 RepID=UPI001F1AF246|nr:ACT domain-containing protein [Pseudomaricurvus sp. HS19]